MKCIFSCSFGMFFFIDPHCICIPSLLEVLQILLWILTEAVAPPTFLPFPYASVALPYFFSLAIHVAPPTYEELTGLSGWGFCWWAPNRIWQDQCVGLDALGRRALSGSSRGNYRLQHGYNHLSPINTRAGSLSILVSTG